MSTEHTHGLFAELLEGAKALEERPRLIAQIQSAEAEAQRAIAEAMGAHARAERLSAHLAEIEAKLADREAALAQATKSAQDAKETLSQIVGLVKGISEDVGAVVELAEPPVPTPTPSEPTGDTPTSSSDPTPGASDGASPTGSVFETGQSEPCPPSTPYGYGHSESGGTLGQSEPDPTHATSDHSKAPTVEIQSAPTVASTTYHSEPRETESSGIHHGKAYWEKPDGDTWRQWAARGGELAPWVRPDQDMDHHN